MYVGTQRRGMGDAASTFQTGASLATPVATAGISAGLSTTTAAGSTAILGLAPTLAVPLIGAALAGVTILVTKLIQNSGCGPTCIQASDYANQAEPLLRQNLNAYFALPKPRPQSAQAAALQNANAIMQKAIQLWSDPALGNAGKKAISDRSAGGCTWKQNTTYAADIMAAGEPVIGQCWNWQNGYIDPIAHDPDVVPDAQAAVSSSAGSLLSAGGGVSPLGLLALAGLVIAGVYFL